MKRSMIATVLVLSLSSTIAQAQQTQPFTGVNTMLNQAAVLLTPLPAPACPATPTYSFCDSIKAQIATWNGYVAPYNHAIGLAREAEAYLNYPQMTPSMAISDVNGLKSIMNQTQTLNWANVNADQAAQSTIAGITSGTPPAVVDNQLSLQMQQSIQSTLLQMGLISAADTRDQSSVDQITIAAANAKNPTETGQMTVQILHIITNQLSRLEQLDEAKINTELVNGFAAAEKLQQTQANSENQHQQLIQQAAARATASPAPTATMGPQ